jgi:hypothetical protein
MSWRAQNRSKDAKTTSAGRAMSENPEPGLWPIQPCAGLVAKRAGWRSQRLICGERGGSCVPRGRARATAQSRPVGARQRGRWPMAKRFNDVGVDRCDQACFFVASLGFLFALRGYSDEEISYVVACLGFAGVGILCPEVNLRPPHKIQNISISI